MPFKSGDSLSLNSKSRGTGMSSCSVPFMVAIPLGGVTHAVLKKGTKAKIPRTTCRLFMRLFMGRSLQLVFSSFLSDFLSGPATNRAPEQSLFSRPRTFSGKRAGNHGGRAKLPNLTHWPLLRGIHGILAGQHHTALPTLHLLLVARWI